MISCVGAGSQLTGETRGVQVHAEAILLPRSMHKGHQECMNPPMLWKMKALAFILQELVSHPLVGGSS